MKRAWTIPARLVVVALLGAAAAAPWVAPYSYEEQFREDPGSPPSRAHWLGTDDLGRDRLSRLIWGTRTSLLLAPAAALLATAIACAVGLVSGYWPGAVGAAAGIATDLFLSLPWLFLLLAGRAMLPLNTAPEVSVAITFGLLGVLGWAPAARVVSATVRKLGESGFVRVARAQGTGPARVLVAQVLPNLKPLAAAQFWLLVPAFILSEANLSMLGLGVAEPLPSLGTLLRELENYSAIGEQPGMLAPVAVLAAALVSLQAAMPSRGTRTRLAEEEN
jgi:ABC-type dipeptide/oligopeptide/nickel transport system permease subunit